MYIGRINPSPVNLLPAQVGTPLFSPQARQRTCRFIFYQVREAKTVTISFLTSPFAIVSTALAGILDAQLRGLILQMDKCADKIAKLCKWVVLTNSKPIF